MRARHVWKIALQFASVAVAALALNSCSETADTGIPVSIPSVRVQCTTNQCKTSAVPTTGLVFTSSTCADPDFGEVIRYVSTSHSCTSGSGCNYNASTSGWVDKSGSSVSTIPSGTYSLCGCLDLDQSSVPFDNCDQESSYGPVLVDSGTTQIYLTGWN